MLQVSGFPLDLNNWFLQFVTTAFFIAFGLLYLVKNTASKYFFVDANFESSGDYSDKKMPAVDGLSDACVVCRNLTTKQCSGCKMVNSADCQRSHWNSGHKTKCKQSASVKRGWITSTAVPRVKQLKKILFPYEEFVELFNWEKPGFHPCGLLNCGNRFAIDTMQSVCLDEFGGEKAVHPSSQETTLIQHIFGGHLQSQVICTECKVVSNQFESMMDLTVEIQGEAASLEECLDQFTAKEWLHGENMFWRDTIPKMPAFLPWLALKGRVKPTNKLKEWENESSFSTVMACFVLPVGNILRLVCNDYVTAWKRLTIRQPPNILTIALKRFQSSYKHWTAFGNAEKSEVNN
ncbi:hypothetical protein RJ639_015086 [Escallonia herrerae]|uniref:Peptidase C19 ubiquitin carboxyl-terminal hydrolase domain-containing protein n=1 Tax=Escallonia herrerae TaxID=1293975 RepID=A0AA88VHJ8_9ASTE|nr:hypothetical protein RJ639_015086 [Escallonia herrerae]